VKILINLQGGSVRVNGLGNTLCIIQRQCRRKIYLETIEGSFPLFSVKASWKKVDRGDVFDRN
jgi:hypothetical protein